MRQASLGWRLTIAAAALALTAGRAQSVGPLEPDRNPARQPAPAMVGETSPGDDRNHIPPTPARNPVRALDHTGRKPVGLAVPPIPERNPAPARRSAQLPVLPAGSPPLPELKPSDVKPPVQAGFPPSPDPNPNRRLKPAVPIAWSPEEIAAAKADCIKRLAGITLEWKPQPALRSGACGLPYPLEVKSIGTSRVLIDPPATMSCALAAGLARWLDDVVQVEAKAAFASTVAAIANGTSYACRNRNGDTSGKLSEHAFANALDIPTFRLTNGRTVAVLDHWGPTIADIESELARKAAENAKAEAERQQKLAAEAAAQPAGTQPPQPPSPPAPEQAEPPAQLVMPTQKRGSLRVRLPQHAPKTPEARFLQRIHAGACPIFGTVLGPEANQAHHDHLHVDQAKRGTTNFCE